jgi:hypothetical protein
MMLKIFIENYSLANTFYLEEIALEKEIKQF